MPDTVAFDAAINTLSSLSPALIRTLLRADIRTIGDVLLHLPIRYEDRTRVIPISEVCDGKMAFIHAQVCTTKISYGRRRMLLITVCDSNGDILVLRYFNYYPNQLKQFTLGRWGLFYGKITHTTYEYEMTHPDIQWLKNSELPMIGTTFTPIYGVIRGVSKSQWRTIVKQSLATLSEQDNDRLTAAGFIGFSQALHTLHMPKIGEDCLQLLSAEHPARQRLIIEELCVYQLSLLRARALQQTSTAPALSVQSDLCTQFLAQLPFSLTSAQQRVCTEIAEDMARTIPMLRLVQGDVGSGKTVVALIACLQAIDSGKQVAFLAPTEILAEQHFVTIQQLLGTLPVRMALLVSRLKTREKRQIINAIAQGEVQLIIGTHAVFQSAVQYQDLALVVIDEQHRFGVQQRLALQGKSQEGTIPHQLILTATPIPRTLAMSIYGVIALSVIDVVPPGRLPVRTSVVSNSKRNQVIMRVGALCRTGKQVYWVCPIIDESETLECENAKATAEQLQQILPDIGIALVHGRQSNAERQAAMQAFNEKKAQILVATTVIEVGVDIPNASVMVIENAERFGLSQLHQLRGRVGRGNIQSDCLLMYQPPLSDNVRRRLSIMRATTDGFRIAEEDLEIRGAGELLGRRQTGALGFKIADIVRDAGYFSKVEALCQRWLADEDVFITVLLKRWQRDDSHYLQA